jgi:hypothetical protein
MPGRSGIPYRLDPSYLQRKPPEIRQSEGIAKVYELWNIQHS